MYYSCFEKRVYSPMKWILITVVLLLFAGLIAYIAMALQSHKRPENIGLQQEVLRICPDSPNCVCSESHSQDSEQHAIAPLKAGDDTWARLNAIIANQGGVIQQDDGRYLHATFTTPVFRYVDDVELRFDQAQGVIHLRSASRVGHSDFSVNRHRIQRIKQRLEKR